MPFPEQHTEGMAIAQLSAEVHLAPSVIRKESVRDIVFLRTYLQGKAEAEEYEMHRQQEISRIQNKRG